MMLSTAVPSWVTTSVGIYALLGSVFMVLMIVVALFMVRALLDLKTEVTRLTNQVSGIAARVDGVAKQVESITTDVGVRTGGILRMVDDAAGGAIGLVERFSPWFLVGGAILKLFFAVRGRSRR